MEKRTKRKQGFTLMEMLVVIAISGILMAVAAPRYTAMVDRAEQTQYQSEAREVLNYVEMHNIGKSATAADRIQDGDKLTELVGTGAKRSIDGAFTALIEDALSSEIKALTVLELREVAKGARVVQSAAH